MLQDRFDSKKKVNWVRHNEQIRVPQVLVIRNGTNLGVMSTRDALFMARSADLDLVEIAAFSKPPVCHIMDYGKYMYDNKKKDKDKQIIQKEKEIYFNYVIDDHDLETKANQCKRFIEKGSKVKLIVRFHGRARVHQKLGFVVLEKVIDLLRSIVKVEKEPCIEGNNVIAKLDIKKTV